MTGKAVTLAALVLPFLASPVLPQSPLVGRLRGRVLEDGRPIQRIVEVRLENEASGLIDTAYTQGSDEFNFPALTIDLNDRYFLVIREPGYTEVRHQLQINRGPFGRIEFGVVILYLNSLPSENEPVATNTVDLLQLTADIPSQARDAYRKALDSLDEGDREAALAALETAVRLAPDFYEAQHALGIEYLSDQRYPDAKRSLQHAFELNQNDPSLLTNLGTLLFQEAQILEDSASSSGDLDAARESYSEAVGHFQNAFRLDPSSARIAFYLGSALYKTGAYGEAESVLLVAVKIDPGMIDARRALINVYVQQNRAEAALEQIELYLESAPDPRERDAMERAREAIRAAIGL